MGETETAYHYASRHLEIAKETGDRTGQATAQVNLNELGKSLGYGDGGGGKVTPGSPQASRRRSMENMQVIKMTPDTKLNARNHDASGEGDGLDQANKSDLLDDEEDFFDFISRSVQVCLITSSLRANVAAGSSPSGWTIRGVRSLT